MMIVILEIIGQELSVEKTSPHLEGILPHCHVANGLHYRNGNVCVPDFQECNFPNFSLQECNVLKRGNVLQAWP